MPTQTASAMLLALAEHEAAVHKFTNASTTMDITWYYSKPVVNRLKTYLEVSQSRYPVKDNWRYGTENWLHLKLMPNARVKRFLASQTFYKVEELRELLVVAARYEKLKALVGN